jgi:hypothetical protein
MSLRLPKVPLIIAAILAIAGGGMLVAKSFLITDLTVLGVSGDLVGIGLLGFSFLVFALSFALATPVEKSEKPAKVKKEKKDKAAVAMLGEDSLDDSGEEELDPRQKRKLELRAEKAAKLAAKKKAKEEADAAREAKKAEAIASKESAKANAHNAKDNAAAAKLAAKEQAAAAKLAIKEAKEAERKRKELDEEEDDEFARPAGEEYLKPLTKEEQEALKEEAEMAKENAKAEAAFVRDAQKQAKVAAKLAAKEEKLRLAEEKKKAVEQAKLDKINAKLAAKEEKLRLKEEKKAAKLAAAESAEAIEVFEYVSEPEVEETNLEVEVEVEEELDEAPELEEDTHAVNAEFEAPELVIPTDEEIYKNEDFVIPFSTSISSRDARLLQEEFMKKIEELSSKVMVLETELEKKVNS